MQDVIEKKFIDIVSQRTGGNGNHSRVGVLAFGESSGKEIWRNLRNKRRKLSISEAQALADVCEKPLSWLIAQAEYEAEALISEFES